MNDFEESFVVAWFPPDGDFEKSFTTEAGARKHAAKESVSYWNPIIFRRVRVTETTETVLPPNPFTPRGEYPNV